MPPAAARKLGSALVFQHFSLFDSLSVLKNIALGLAVGVFRRGCGSYGACWRGGVSEVRIAMRGVSRAKVAEGALSDGMQEEVRYSGLIAWRG